MELRNIAQGFINSTKAQFGLGNDEIEKKAAERYFICLNCPLISESKTNCTKCGCLLSAKTRSDSKCPENKW